MTPGIIYAGDPIVVSASADIKAVNIYSVTGAMVAATSAYGTQVTLDAPAVTPGMYLVNVTTANGSTVKKIIIK